MQSWALYHSLPMLAEICSGNLINPLKRPHLPTSPGAYNLLSLNNFTLDTPTYLTYHTARWNEVEYSGTGRRVTEASELDAQRALHSTDG